MKKLLTALCLTAAFWAPAQTLFTYGNESVPAGEFLQAFQKINTGPVTQKALKEYLDLYMASRLKIKAAKEKGYDTLPQLQADLASLRQQLIPAYLNDKESLDKLVAEAFSRSQNDLHVAHIFIKSGEDAAAAEEKKARVLQALSKEDFAAVAKKYSDDPAAKTNSGDLGWLTVFSLPYELENLAWKTPVGKTSAVYRSVAGYHILKVLGKRKALGRIRAAQILLALPPNSTNADREALRQKADSLYRRLQAGDDFGRLAALFSNDVTSAANNGQLKDFSVGEYDPIFEGAALALPSDGAFSKPFLTDYGYHIVKRIKRLPPPATLTAETRNDLLRRVEQSDRIQFAQNVLAEKVLQEAGYQKLPFADAELWAYTDSVLAYQQPRMPLTLRPESGLLKIRTYTATVRAWIGFVQTNRFRPDGTGAKHYPQLFEEFTRDAALNYYRDHLEDFNTAFRRQMAEFAEGNLFFEVMQRQVWTPAQSDSAALKAYYQAHRDKYYWKESADAVVFYAATKEAAAEFYEALRKTPSAWKTLLQDNAERISADSNRFELDQIPAGEKQPLIAGTVTTPLVNSGDNTAAFALVLRLHSQPEPRSFADAKSLVINDYQNKLEKEWLDTLRKKYPVHLNEKVWSDVVKKATAK